MNAVERSCPRLVRAIVQPPFSSPTRLSTGTRTSSKNTSEKCEPPVMSRSGRLVSPSLCMSIKT